MLIPPILNIEFLVNLPGVKMGLTNEEIAARLRAGNYTGLTVPILKSFCETNGLLVKSNMRKAIILEAATAIANGNPNPSPNGISPKMCSPKNNTDVETSPTSEGPECSTAPQTSAPSTLSLGPTTVIPGGTTAAKNGKKFEDMVKSLLNDIGFVQRKHGHIPREGEQFYIKEYRITDYMGREGCRLDFYVYDGLRKLEWSLDCKSQTVSGSVDNKFPLVYGNAKKAHPGTSVIILHGNGASKQAMRWLYEKVNSYPKKKMYCFILDGDDMDPLLELLLGDAYEDYAAKRAAEKLAEAAAAEKLAAEAEKLAAEAGSGHGNIIDPTREEKLLVLALARSPGTRVAGPKSRS